MKLKVRDNVAEALKESLQEFDLEEKFHGKDRLDLSTLTRQECEALEELFDTSDVYGTGVLATDVRKYLKAADKGVESVKARKMRQGAWLLEHLIADLPHHLVFSRDAYEGGSHTGYFVNDVNFKAEQKRTKHKDYRPAQVLVELIWIDKGIRESKDLDLREEDVLGKTATQMLNDQGYVLETPDLVDTMRDETERYYDLIDQVGEQYWATGVAVTDLDDATDSGSKRRKVWSRRTNRVNLQKNRDAARVVIDVRHETSDARKKHRNKRGRRTRVNLYRWHDRNLRFFSPSGTDEDRHIEANEDTTPRPDLEVPEHPLVPVYDLEQHQRCRVHVNNLTPYEYDENVKQGLVLPDRDLDMVDTLLEHEGADFEDVVPGKGSSLNILAEGPPGTGKTLTAEVFAEVKHRPLYPVDCAQLGTTPKTVEQNLSVVLQRANRWNAVLLLDEADVYIRERGTDIQHNAIVGVFLRLLERADCILWLTTNLPEHVDDAIASRCIARLRYTDPGQDRQAKIWRVLADQNDLRLPDKTIEVIAHEYPHLTGRDVKNLLKLASITTPDDEAITVERIEHAMQFKPTTTNPQEDDDD